MAEYAYEYTYRRYEKIYIAQELLNKAIELFEMGDNYFASLHLAGAAEEVLGKILEAKGIENSLQSQKRAFIEINKLNGRHISKRHAAAFLNRSKNAIKHLDYTKEADFCVDLDAKEEARDLIKRAISNCWKLEIELSPAMMSF